MANIAMVVTTKRDWLEAPKSRTIRRSSSSFDDDNDNVSGDGGEDSNGHNQSLEAGLHFFDSFQETPKGSAAARACATRSFSFDNESTDTNNSELAINDAVSGALVGENVLDSPGAGNCPKKYRKKIATPSASSTPSAPGSIPSLSEPLSMSVGLVTQGLSWIRLQREERRRRYLQHQAEEQALKIREAQLAEGMSTGAGATSTFSLSGPGRISPAATTSTFKKIASVLTSGTRVGCGEDLGTCADSHGGDYHNNYNYDENNSVTSTDEIIQKSGLSCSGNGFMVEFAVPEDDTDDSEWVPPVRIESEEGKSASPTPFILTPAQCQQIAQRVLPSGIVYAKWRRLYSLARDGDSFEACLRLVAGHSKTLLVLRTSNNEILGGFADTAWDHPTVGGNQYFGGSTSCVFSFANATTSGNNGKKKQEEEKPRLNVYTWTGKNRYIQLCDAQHKMLAFGGGGENGAFGLSVAHDFQHGTSGPCDTFGNEPLSPRSTNFRIVDLEIYCFLLGQF
ncbi:hypothetical protein ACA910_001085 [Epithemia clementina (nom. ined.)]